MKHFDRLVHVFEVVACSAAIVMAFIIFINIVLRPFGYPIRGIYDLVCILAVVGASCALAPCQKKGGHVAVDFFIALLPKKARKVLEMISFVIILCFLGFVVWRFFAHGINMMRQGGATMPVYDFIPLHLFYYFIGLACTVLWLVFLVQFKEKLSRRVKA